MEEKGKKIKRKEKGNDENSRIRTNEMRRVSLTIESRVNSLKHRIIGGTYERPIKSGGPSCPPIKPDE